MKMDELKMKKLQELLHKQEAEKKQESPLLWVLAVIGVLLIVAGIAYAAYKYFTPDYLEDFEDEFDDDFEEDFEDEFDEELDDTEPIAEEPAE